MTDNMKKMCDMGRTMNRALMYPYGDSVRIITTSDLDKLDTESMITLYKPLLKLVMFRALVGGLVDEEVLEKEIEASMESDCPFNEIVITLSYFQGYITERLGAKAIEDMDTEMENEIMNDFARLQEEEDKKLMENE